jgi:hypothetical protein
VRRRRPCRGNSVTPIAVSSHSMTKIITAHVSGTVVDKLNLRDWCSTASTAGDAFFDGRKPGAAISVRTQPGAIRSSVPGIAGWRPAALHQHVQRGFCSHCRFPRNHGSATPELRRHHHHCTTRGTRVRILTTRMGLSAW